MYPYYMSDIFMNMLKYDILINKINQGCNLLTHVVGADSSHLSSKNSCSSQYDRVMLLIIR